MLAGLAGAAVAVLFDFAVAERVVDRAVQLEEHGRHAAVAVPEPFSRTGQRGGLVAGELILGAGVAFLLAGFATLLGPRARSAQRLWLLLTAAAIWGVVVLPAAIYPPLPPGVASARSIGDRQLLYLAVVAVGVAGFAAAVRAWPASRPLAVAAFALPAALVIALFPENRASTADLPAGFLTDFRLVSIASQLLFWAALATAGWLLLRRRAELNAA